jgi:hypothetical protein
MEHHGYLFDMDDAKNHVMTLYCYRRRHAPRKRNPAADATLSGLSTQGGLIMTNRRRSATTHSVRAQTPEQLLELTQEYIRPLIGMIDELNEAGAEDELRVIRQQLTRLVFRAQPLPRAASSPKNRSARHRAAVSPS